MSVLINMKMPEISENRTIKAEIRNVNGKVEFGIMTGGYYCCEQLKYYPLVEVPPHGRLGDLDALKKKALIRSERRGRFVNVTDMVISAYDIETAPTIIPAEEE